MRRIIRLTIHPLLIALLMSAPVSAAEPNASDDPHLWLEDVMGEKPLAWVRERNAKSMAALAGSEDFKRLEARILSILDSQEKIPFVTDRKSTRLNSSHEWISRMPSSA